MFRLVKERTAWWPVAWRVPTEDGHEAEEARIELQFRVLGMDDIRPLMERAVRIDDAGKSPSETMAEVFAQVVCDWRGVGDERGVKLEFTSSNFQALLNLPGSYEAVLDAYRKCVRGEAEIRAKN